MSLVSVLEAPVRVAEAIKSASRATGADFGYLLKTAARESNFNNSAKAKSSSAAGLFQFIENTWLGTLKESGSQFGLEKYSDSIFKTSSGRYYVPNPQMRQEILKLRHDPEISSVMAGMFTQQNAEYISSRIGREPTEGELYIGHFLGPNGGARMIDLATTRPSERADHHFPQAARANRSIFYSKGRPRTLGEVYRVLVAKHNKNQVAAPTVAQLPERNPVAAAELKAVAAIPEKVPPLPQRRLALGQQPNGSEGLGSVGQWVTIVQSADEGAAPRAAAVRPEVAGWLKTARTPARTAAEGQALLPRRTIGAVDKVAERAPAKSADGAEPRVEIESRRAPRAQPRAPIAKTRDDIAFENFFQHMSLSG
jgi:hypothetical protein